MSEQTTGSNKAGAAAPDVRELLGRRPILRRRLEKRRLAGEILLVRARYADLEGRLSRACPSEQNRKALQGRLESVRDRLVAAAARALAAGDIDNGWKSLQELEREMVPVLDPMELDARFVSARSEAQKKLGQWRGLAAQCLAERYGKIRPESADIAARQRILQEILFHLHSTHQNTYHKLDKLHTQLRIVAAGVAVTLALILVLNYLGFFTPLGDQVQWRLWVAMISGLTGGVLSVASSAVRADPGRRIPEVSASFAVTLVRPLVGPTIALPLLFFVESGLVNLGMGDDKLWVLLTLCFVGGFSERWFLGIVGGLGKRAEAAAESGGKE